MKLGRNSVFTKEMAGFFYPQGFTSGKGMY